MRPSRHIFRAKTILAGIIVSVVLIAIGTASWFFIFHKNPDADPFSAVTLATLDFPIYYPRTLPSGFRIDPKSVAEPSSGVAVFMMTGPHDEKLYMSQEARPATFNFGGYYKAFENLQEKTISSGTIAVGHINSGVTSIGSLATDKTWIVVNTTSKLPLDELTALLNSLAVSH